MQKKDWWDRSLIIGQIAGAIFVPFLLLLLTVKLSSIEKSLDYNKHDLAILQEFRSVYSDKENRGLSLRYLKLLRDSKTQVEARTFVTWNLLKQIVKNHKFIGQKYTFDSNSDECHYLSENISELCEVNKTKGLELFRTLLTQGPTIYKDYTTKEEFSQLFFWLWNRTAILKANIAESELPRP